MKQVLIVDDEKSLLQSLESGLEAYSDQFKVLTAEDGKRALDTIRKHAVDLVVTDLKMPEMDGFELLAVLSTDYPSIRTMVMTAFGTPETDAQINQYGTFTILEKPIGFSELAETICTKLEQDLREGSVAGISLAGFLQLIEMEQKTCLLEVYTEKNNRGYFYMREGDPCDAIFEGAKSEEAVYRMLALKNVHIKFKALPPKHIKKQIQADITTLLLNGARFSDEGGDLSEEGDLLETDKPKTDLPGMDSLDTFLTEEEDGLDPSTHGTDDAMDMDSEHKTQLQKGDNDMQEIKDVLEKMSSIDGFKAIGVFSPNGEMVEQVNNGGMEIGELGALANDVLLKAQKATDMMDVGRGQQVHIEAPKAHVIARCLNEATDFAATTSGRAHLHVVLILDTEGNLAMGKMKLHSIIQELAPMFR